MWTLRKSLVKAINNIYIRSPFIVKKGGKDVKIRPRFQVKRVKIDESSNENDPFRSKNIGVEKFLEKASLGNFDDYCLAYVFTKRDFQNGVLGLAWVAQPEGNSGQGSTNRLSARNVPIFLGPGPVKFWSVNP